MRAHPLDIELARPSAWRQPTTVRAANGTERDLPRFQKHLLCDSDGTCPVYFDSSWEEKVVDTELKREGNVGWYRNPKRAAQESLGVTYEDGDEMKLVRPDFIFFAIEAKGTIA